MPFLPTRGRVSTPVQMSYVRDLTPEDLVQLATSLPRSAPCIKQARAIHHRQAQLVAEGRSDIEVAAITGRSPVRVSQLKVDPTFQNLVAYYQQQIEGVELETHRRMQETLIDVLELAAYEMRDRLEDEAARAALPMSELRKLAEFAADRTIAPAKTRDAAAGLPPARIELNFGFTKPNRSEAEAETTTATATATALIDITPTEG